MSKHHTRARSGNRRQAIRDALQDMPEVLDSDVVDVPAPTTHVAEPAPAAEVEVEPSVDLPDAPAPAREPVRPRRGWFSFARRQGGGKADDALHEQAAQIERHAEQLDTALNAVREQRDDRDGAGRDETPGRLAQLEADLAAEQSAHAQAQTAAEHLQDRLAELHVELERLQGHAAELHEEQQAHARSQAVAEELEHQLVATRAAHDSLSAEHHSLTTAYAQLEELHHTEREALSQWEAHAKELTDTLAAEREDFLRTLDDERHTAEQARAEQAFQHRERTDALQAESAAAVAAVERVLAETQSVVATATADLAATRAEVDRVTDDLKAARGEAEAANLRAVEEGELRQRAEQRLEEVRDELAYVRNEVFGSAGGGGKKRGLLRRGGPAPLKNLQPTSRPVPQKQGAAAPAAVSEELDEILERRLFGDS